MRILGRFTPAAAIIFLLTGCAVRSGNSESISLAEGFYRMVVGGTSISEATLLRFYAWHVMGLAVPVVVLFVWHGFRVRRDGGISSPERVLHEPAPPRVMRETLVRGDWLTFFLTFVSIILLSIFVDAPLGPSAQPGALVEDSHAPWIFLWVQELLRIWPAAIAGVLTPLVVLLVLTFMPWLDWSNDGVAVWFNRQGRTSQIVMIVLFLSIVGLTIRAALR